MEEPDWFFIGESGFPLADAATQTLASPTPLEGLSSEPLPPPAGPALDYGIVLCGIAAAGCIGFGAGTLLASRLWSNPPTKGAANAGPAAEVNNTAAAAPPTEVAATAAAFDSSALLALASAAAPVSQEKVVPETPKALELLPEATGIESKLAYELPHGLPRVWHSSSAENRVPALPSPVVTTDATVRPEPLQTDPQYWQCAVVAGLGATLVASSVLLARFGMMRAVAPRQLSAVPPMLSAPHTAPPALRTCTQPTPHHCAAPPAIAPTRVATDERAGGNEADTQTSRPAPNMVGSDKIGFQNALPTSGLLSTQLSTPQMESLQQIMDHSFTGDIARIGSNQPTVDMPMKILCTSHTLRKTAHRAHEVWIMGGRVCAPLPTSSAVFRLLPKQ
mmetsp:Transcript_16046/g.36804  ORF Transcript_16046/g.36804 Transcript_16046/m.36804 type:complete len:392 (-) Transcript_16046:179-1354(-)